jgi:hypothetical protein
LFIAKVLRFRSKLRLLYVDIGIFEQLLENGVHRVAECPTLRLRRLQEPFLEVWSGDLAPDEPTDEIEI